MLQLSDAHCHRSACTSHPSLRAPRRGNLSEVFVPPRCHLGFPNSTLKGSFGREHPAALAQRFPEERCQLLSQRLLSSPSVPFRFNPLPFSWHSLRLQTRFRRAPAGTGGFAAAPLGWQAARGFADGTRHREKRAARLPFLGCRLGNEKPTKEADQRPLV